MSPQEPIKWKNKIEKKIVWENEGRYKMEKNSVPCFNTFSIRCDEITSALHKLPLESHHSSQWSSLVLHKVQVHVDAAYRIMITHIDYFTLFLTLLCNVHAFIHCQPSITEPNASAPLVDSSLTKLIVYIFTIYRLCGDATANVIKICYFFYEFFFVFFFTGVIAIIECTFRLCWTAIEWNRADDW